MQTYIAAVKIYSSAVRDPACCSGFEPASGSIRKGNKGSGYIVWHDENLFLTFLKLYSPSDKIKFITKENLIKNIIILKK